MLRDYLGLPSTIQGLGEVYPVKILEYERFRDLAQKYILLSNKYKEVMLEVEIKETQYEMLLMDILRVETIYNAMNNESISETELVQLEQMVASIGVHMSFEEFCELLKMVTKKDFKFDKNELSFISEDGNYYLDNENFDLFREEVLRQNMLYEPLFYEDMFTQELLEDWRRLERQDMSKEDSDMESIIQYVAIKKHSNQEEVINMTYYQLMADYMRIQIDEGYQFMKSVISSGNANGKAKLPNPAKKVDLDIHPEERGFLKQGNDNERLDNYLGAIEV